MRQLIDRQREIITVSRGLNRVSKDKSILPEKSIELKKLQDREYKRYLFFKNVGSILSENKRKN